jgi:hypothetical protein
MFRDGRGTEKSAKEGMGYSHIQLSLNERPTAIPVLWIGLEKEEEY